MTRPLPTLLVFSAYAIAMALLSKVVMSIPLGITYALWSGIGTVAIVLGWSLRLSTNDGSGATDRDRPDHRGGGAGEPQAVTPKAAINR
jgi:hypothetical protein